MIQPRPWLERQPRRRFAWRAAACAGAVFLASWAGAQDANYWTEQFGNTARLLGGAVVGSVEDTSAVYYNPGALALNESFQAVLSANVVDLSAFRAQPVGGFPGVLQSARFRWVPSIVAGELKRPRLGRNRLAWSFLVRQDHLVSMEDHQTSQIPGAGPAATSIRLDARLSEYWGGVTWARPMSRRVGLGATLFVAGRSSSARPEFVVQTAEDRKTGGLTLVGREYELTHVRLLAKVGLNARVGTWALGLAVTTPSMSVWGRGLAGYDQSTVSTGAAGVSSLATDHQEELAAHVRSPLAVALGLARTVRRTRVHFSAEWFGKVGPMTILAPKPFTALSSGQTVTYDVTYGLGAVLNGGIGLERSFGPRLKLYAGFRTDVSGGLSRQQSNSTFSAMDLKHASLGGVVRAGRADLTLGFGYGWGSRVLPPFVEGAPAGALAPPSFDARWQRFTVILGVNLQAGKSNGR